VADKSSRLVKNGSMLVKIVQDGAMAFNVVNVYHRK
jgi:hypothetical protein